MQEINNDKNTSAAPAATAGATTSVVEMQLVANAQPTSTDDMLLNPVTGLLQPAPQAAGDKIMQVDGCDDVLDELDDEEMLLQLDGNNEDDAAAANIGGGPTCELCGGCTKNHRNYHYIRHFKEKLSKMCSDRPFVCNICQQEAKTKINLWTHYLGKHGFLKKWVKEKLEEIDENSDAMSEESPAVSEDVAENAETAIAEVSEDTEASETAETAAEATETSETATTAQAEAIQSKEESHAQPDSGAEQQPCILPLPPQHPQLDIIGNSTLPPPNLPEESVANKETIESEMPPPPQPPVQASQQPQTENNSETVTASSQEEEEEKERQVKQEPVEVKEEPMSENELTATPIKEEAPLIPSARPTPNANDSTVTPKRGRKPASTSCGPFWCDLCQSVVTTNTTQPVHFALVHFVDRLQNALPTQAPFCCPLCKFEAKNHVNLSSHYLTKHPSGATTFMQEWIRQDLEVMERKAIAEAREKASPKKIEISRPEVEEKLKSGVFQGLEDLSDDEELATVRELFKTDLKDLLFKCLFIRYLG